MESELERIMEIANAAEGPVPEHELRRVEGALAHATEMLVQVSVRMFPYAGASALHLSSPIQRALRDLIGSGQHFVASNQQIEAWGGALLEPAREDA